MQEAGIVSYDEFFHTALPFLFWGIDESKKDRDIASMNLDTSEWSFITMGFMINIRNKKSVTPASVRFIEEIKKLDGNGS